MTDIAVDPSVASTHEAPKFVYEPDEAAGKFVMLIAQEGVPTVDGRMFTAGSIDWRELPMPLTLNRVNSAEGQHKTAVGIGAITRIERQDGNIYGWGYFSTDEHGQDARKLIKEGMISNVSADVGGVISSEFAETEVPEGVRKLFTKGTIIGVTALLHSSFNDTKIAVDGDGTQFAAAKVTEVEDDEDEMEEDEVEEADETEDEDALTAAAARGWTPPADAFKNPNLSRPTPLTITDDGRVFGHAAVFGTCHVGYKDRCVTPPRSNKGYSYFNVGEVLTDSGDHVPVGRITANTSHAALELAAQPAKEHYDHTGFAAAYVKAGEDEHGIWFAGVVAPDATDAQIANLRAAGVSGDWRNIGGNLEMVGLLAVNTPGFPVPRMGTGLVAGAQMSLVAAGMVAEEVVDLANTLKGLLADTQVVYHQAHGYHWNVKGSDFAQYHELFGGISDDLHGSIDPLAENIRKLNADAPFSLESFSALSSIGVPDTEDDSPEELAKALLVSIDQMVESLKQAFDVADRSGEQGIANFVADRLDATQKWAWQLRSSVDCGCGCGGDCDGETDLPSIPGMTAAADDDDCGCSDEVGFTVSGKRCDCESEELSAQESEECGCGSKKMKKKGKYMENFAFNGGTPVNWTTDLDQNVLNGVNEHLKQIIELTEQTNQMGSRISMQVQGYTSYLRGMLGPEVGFINRSLGLPGEPETPPDEQTNSVPDMAYEVQLALLDFDMELGL